MKKTKIFTFVVVCLFGLSFTNVASAMTPQEQHIFDLMSRVIGLQTQLIENLQQQLSITTDSIVVDLAATSPKEGALLSKQSGAKLIDLEFKGAGTVTSVTLHHSGFSDVNALTSVYLYDGETRLTDGYTFNSAGDLVMNNLNIAVNGSKVISVKGDVASSVTTYANIAVALTCYTTGGVATAVNVQGATIPFVNSIIATVSMVTNTAVSSSTVNVGTVGYTVWKNSLIVGTRSVELRRATFKVVGSAPSTSLSNIALVVDGERVGNYSSIDASGNIVFVIAKTMLLATGTHTLEVRADIVAGADRTFNVSLQKAGDIQLIDSVYGVNVSISTKNTTVKVGSFTIVAGATEAIHVKNLNISFLGSAGVVEVFDISNLKVSLDGGLTFSTPIRNPSLISNNFSVDFIVTTNSTKAVDVYVDVTDTSINEMIIPTLRIAI